VSLFSVIGASLSFLIARYIFRAELEKKYQNKVNTINKGLHKNLWNYLFFIRIAAVFPFFIVNIVLGLSRVSLKNFFISTFIGMLPVIFIYAFAGRQLVQLNSLKDVFSFNILIVFFLFGLLLLAPIILKKITRKIYK
ncbi:VTT domain-containing protein, partial [bacterium]|nr:VTT domain-containing protein [bacterium]